MTGNFSTAFNGLLRSSAHQPTGAAGDPPDLSPPVSPAVDAPRAWRPIGDEDQTAQRYYKGAGSFKDGKDRKDSNDRSLHCLPSLKSLRSSTLELARKPTLDDVLDACRHYELRPLWLGQITHGWIVQQPDRAAALKQLKLDLVRLDMVGVACRLDFFLHVYWVAWLFGWDEAQGLKIAAIRELRRLVARNAATEEYSIRRNCQRPAQALWRRMVKEGLPASQVRREVARIRPPAKKRGPKPSAKFLAILRDLRRLEADEAQLQQIIRICEDRLANRTPAAEAYQPAA